MTAALLIFFLTYLAITGRRLGLLRISRPAAALAGAAACVLFGVLLPEQAYQSMDGDTLILLLALMIIASHLDHAGFFEWGASVALRIARSPGNLLTVIVFSSGILSAVLVDDTVCFLMTPFVVRIIQRLRLGGRLFLLAVATSANLGGTMTLIGNPQTILVGSISDLSFTSYLIIMAPLGLMCLLLNRLLLPRFFPFQPARDQHPGNPSEPLNTGWDDADILPTDFRHTMNVNINQSLLIKSCCSLALALGGIFAGWNMAWTAMSAAGFLLILAGWEPKEAFKRIDWQLLLFVTGLFVVVGGIRNSGIGPSLYDQMSPIFGDHAPRQGWMLSLVSMFGCNLVGRIPFVLVAADWMHHFVNPTAAWMILAMSTSFAGNLTLASSMSNVLVRAAGRGTVQIRFAEHLRYGIVITSISTALGVLWILLWT